MFKKTKEPQLNMFRSPSSILLGKPQKIDHKAAGYNQSRQQVSPTLMSPLSMHCFVTTMAHPIRPSLCLLP